jgi:methylenetetrahydrofolate dehydrogenase (NADP+)/methenyltetrahydrofolate cyclohydrolase
MSQARIIDGKAFAAQLREQVAAEVASLKAEHGLTPGLAVVLVGEDPASQVYVRSKGEQTTAAGMHSETHRLPEQTSLSELLSLVERLNDDPAIHGDPGAVSGPRPHEPGGHRRGDLARQGRRRPDRDQRRPPGQRPAGPDRLHAGRLHGAAEGRGRRSAGKRAVVIGRSNLMGKPMAQLLLAADCTVTIAHSRTQDLAAVCREADILVAAVGRPQMVKGDWIKPGATVIDVGINRIPKEDGKTRLVGDVDFEEAKAVAGAITPVPGGVGPMTIAMLLANTVSAAKRLNGIAD